MTPFTRFLAFEALGWALAAAVLAWAVGEAYFSARVAVLLFVAWVVKDFALYPMTKKAYEHGPTHGAAELIGSEVRVVEAVAPEGYVQAGRERWRARLTSSTAAPLAEGARARVAALDGVKLVVEPAE